MRTRARAAFAALPALAAVLATPAMAQAASLTVTGDNGNPVALTPGAAVVIRNMDVKVGETFAATEKYYSLSVAGPAGGAGSVTCYSVGTGATSVDYQGNGTYTATVTTYPDGDFNCASPLGSVSASYVVNAGVRIAPPAGNVLTRKPNEFSTIDYAVPITLNPGALGYEVRLAKGGVLAPDGSISGPSEELFVDTSTGTVSARFPTPGGYLMVARAKAFSGSAGQFYSPWSAPVRVTALGPFDFEIGSPKFVDDRGPSYKMRVVLRERSATGKVKIAAKRGKHGRYVSLDKAKIRHGKFTKRFTLRRTGRCKVKFSYNGSATVAAGIVVQKARITLHRFF
jgi:hypothetical protein